MRRIVLSFGKAPTIDEIRKVTEAITNIGAKLALIMLLKQG